MENIEQIKALLKNMGLSNTTIKERLMDIKFQKNKHSNLLQLDEVNEILKKELGLDKLYSTSKMYSLVKNNYLKAFLNSKKEGYLIDEESVYTYIDFKKTSKQELFSLFKMRKQLQLLLENEINKKEQRIIYEDSRYEDDKLRREYLKIVEKNDEYTITASSGKYTRYSSTDFDDKSMAWDFEISTNVKKDEHKNIVYFKRKLRETCTQLKTVIGHLNEEEYFPLIDSIYKTMNILNDLTVFTKVKLENELQEEYETFSLMVDNLTKNNVNLFIPNSWKPILFNLSFSKENVLTDEIIEQDIRNLGNEIIKYYLDSIEENVIASPESLIDYFEEVITLTNKERDLIEKGLYEMHKTKVLEKKNKGNLKLLYLYYVYEFYFLDANIPNFTLKYGISLGTKEKMIYLIE